MGTLDYMSKEQAESSKSVDIRADIYSLGCTLYCLLTGQAPYERHSSPAQKLQAILVEDFPALPEREDITRELRIVLERLTAKDPEGRFSTPDDVIQAIAPLAGGDLGRLVAEWDDPDSHSETGLSSSQSLLSASVETDQVTVKPVPKFQKPRRNRWRWGLAGLGLAAAVAVAGAFLSNPKPKVDPVIEPRDAAKKPTGQQGEKRPSSRQGAEETVVREIPLLTDNPSTWSIVRSGREILLFGQDTTLLSLGKTQGPADNLELAANLYQNRWPGRIGLFFHFQPSKQPRLAWQYEVIEIERLPDETCKLAHRFCVVTKTNAYHRYHLASAELAPLTDAAKDLQVEFLEGKPRRVSFDGKEFAKLTVAPNRLLTEEAKQAYAQSLWGEYGVCGDSGAATFSKIRIDEAEIQLSSEPAAHTQ
jgi:hypothetical protein